MKLSTDRSDVIKSRILLLSLLSLLFGCLGGAMGYASIIILPFSVASLASLILVDPSCRKWVSIAISAVVVLAGAVLSGGFYVSGALVVLCALCVFFLTQRGASIAEIAVYLTALVILYIFCGILFLAFSVNDSFSFSKAFETIANTASYIRDQILTFDYFGSMSELGYNAAGQMVITPETEYIFLKTIDLALRLVWGYLIAIAFVISGICIKTFRGLCLPALCPESAMRLSSRRFNASTTISVAFIVISVINLFTIATPLAVVIGNLYYAFAIAFIYIGIRIVYVNLAARFGKLGGAAFLVIGLMIMSSTVLDVLALVGAVTAIISNKVTDKINKNEKKSN